MDQDLLLRHQEEKKALELVRKVAELRFDKGVELLLFRKPLYDAKPSEIIQFHQLSKAFTNDTLAIDQSIEIAETISSVAGLAPARLDIGTMAVDWINGGKQGALADYITGRLAGFEDSDYQSSPKDVVLYGFGRIGRLLARIMIDNTGRGDQLRLKAIVLRGKLSDRRAEIEKRLALLESDSVHGTFNGSYSIAEDNSHILISGSKVQMIFAGSPVDIDYTDYGIHDALLIDNTGIYRDSAGLSNHLRPGIAKVLLTAPGKDIENIVYGVNHENVSTDMNIVSAASCTTNAIVPPIQVIDSNFKIRNGHIETIHSYTSDQNLLDNFHKKPRRGRAAAINMVLTNTGAASAVAKVYPHLKGVLTGNAVRVPTPNVSLAIMVLNVEKATSVEEVNTLMRNASLKGELAEQLHYSISEEFVSSHVVGYNAASIYDAPSTIVSADGKTITVYAWYDNEYGYSHQVIRLAKHMGGVRRKVLY